MVSQRKARKKLKPHKERLLIGRSEVTFEILDSGEIVAFVRADEDLHVKVAKREGKGVE